MDWLWALLLIIGGLIVLMLTGLPIAFCFLIICIVGAYIVFGGEGGLRTLVDSIFSSLNNFTLVAVPMYVLMGEIMSYSGMGARLVNAVDVWLGRMPGRLGLLGVGAATLFATVSGSTMATTAMLGTVLVPEMTKRGYKHAMSLGPIVGSGGLAMMIPPSALGVLLAAIAKISVSKLLIGGIIPGLMMAGVFSVYIIGRSWLQPELAPPYEVPYTPMSKKLGLFARDVLPLGFLIFLVIGLLFLGVATPSEAAAVGVIGAVILAFAYRSLTWQAIKKSLSSTLNVTVMVFMIIAVALVFSQLLAFSGASAGLIELATGFSGSPIAVLLMMQFIVLVLGCFMDNLSLMLITIPIFMPIVANIGWDPIWFSIILLVNVQTALITPPFGLNLFVMKSVSPPDVTMSDVISAAAPFVVLNIVIMAILMASPSLTLWLPNLVK